MSTHVVVRVSHRYTAAAERVFDAWLTPAQASRFMFATRTGNIMCCQIDAYPGGGFLVTDRRPQAEGDDSVMDAEHRGDYVAIERPHRLVFDFNVPPYVEPPTRVTIELRPLSSLACELTLTHDLGDSDMARAYEQQTRDGWTRMLATLERELFPKRVGVQI